jgi:hypothetical protein
MNKIDITSILDKKLMQKLYRDRLVITNNNWLAAFKNVAIKINELQKITAWNETNKPR